MSRRQSQIIDEEVAFDKGVELVSVTDARGVIKYANNAFCTVSGFSLDELQGKNHNIVRHPDMPKAAFADMWEKLQAGESWRGAVKNRCKDGRYYWVDAFVTPVYEKGTLAGYQSVRTQLAPQFKDSANSLYRKINAGAPVGESRLTSFTSRMSMFVLLGAIILFFSQSVPLLGIALIALPLATFAPELFIVRAQINCRKDAYDSISRYIYSGTGPDSIIKFGHRISEGKIATILGRIVDAAQQLVFSAQGLKSASQEAKIGIQQELKEVEESSSAIEKMALSIEQVAHSTELTEQKVSFVHRECETANSSMNDTMQNISGLAKEVSDSAAAAKELSEEAEQIGNVMLEIQGIADQTNLLALNAAIEAARAGEQGRGFSVVADEVRALSTRTHKATEQIQVSISEIQKTLLNWSNKMIEGKATAEHCVNNSIITKDLLTNIFSEVSEIANFAKKITSASERQTEVSKAIVNGFSSINESCHSNLAQIEIVEKEAIRIEDKSAQLASMPQTFEK